MGEEAQRGGIDDALLEAESFEYALLRLISPGSALALVSRSCEAERLGDDRRVAGDVAAVKTETAKRSG